jgi:hypothetical protein
MPFSSQPRKKGFQQGQGEISSCPSKKVIDLPTEKKLLANITQKIDHLLHKDKKAIEKAAFVLSSWISRKTK